MEEVEKEYTKVKKNWGMNGWEKEYTKVEKKLGYEGGRERIHESEKKFDEWRGERKNIRKWEKKM